MPVSLCLACPTFYPVHGGAQLRFARYLPGFQARGLATRVYTGTPPQRRITATAQQQSWYHQRVGEWLRDESLGATPLHRLRLPEQQNWYRDWVYQRGLWQLCQRLPPQILQLIPPLGGGAIPWLWALRRQGVRLVMAHTLPHRQAPRLLKRHWQQLLRQGLYQCMDHIVSNSPHGLAQLRELGVRTPCSFIPNGVDTQRFRPPQPGEREALRQHLDLPLDRPLVVSVGAVSARKGTDLMVAAWAELQIRVPGALLLVIGPRRESGGGDRQFQQHLDAHLAAVPEGVRFIGQRHDVDAFLRAADGFLFASQKEGMPNALLEAMATGLPVVTTPFEGLGEHLGRAKREYLLAAHQAAPLAQALEACLCNPSRAASLGDAARTWVCTHLGLDACLDRYAALYQGLAEEPKTSQ